ncbi:unnamed protein product [Aspergillus oryzae]|nr:unnamed protein product [Aspergillus oryzae]
MTIRQHPSPFTLEFDSLVQRQLEKWKAYGIAEFPDKKMTVDSLFTTCSTTKAFTAAAVSMVIDDTKKTPSPLRWDTPIASLIRDDFVLADNHATMNTTLEDALAHRSGLPGHLFAMIGAYPNETLREAVRKLRHLPLAYPPRTTFDYCNHMFMVVSHVLEQITGESLGEFLRKRIWSPLNMKDTYFSVQDVKRCPVTSPKLVQGYTWVPEKGCYVAEPHMNYAPTTGTGAMVSNVLDYAKWLRAMIYKKAPISPEGHTSLIHPRTVVSKDDKDTAYPPAPYHLYALGWFVDTYRGQQLYWHSGSWAGFGIMVGFIAEKQFGFAIMGNTQRARNAQLELYLYLIDTLLGVSGSERVEFIERMTKRMADVAEKRSESINETKKRLFPSLLAKPLPHILSLHAYTGIYSHPGYGIITLRVKDGHLQADLSDRVEAMTISLEHTAGEFFVARMSILSLPSLPAKHEDFISWINKNQATPIAQLIKPYNEHEAVVRKLFAQEPSHPALRDNHLNIVPLYDTSGKTIVPSRPRDPSSESPDLQEKYVMPLKAESRRAYGDPAVVSSLEDFRNNFNIFSEGSLSDMDWNNVVVAGSAVVTCLMPVPEQYRGSKRALRQFYHDKYAPASDVDLFLYGLTEEQAIEKIKQIEDKIKNAILYETTTIRTKNTITIVSQYPTRHVQIVLPRLLVLERLPKSSDRDAYLEQRREERGRPARQQQMRSLKSLNGNVKSDWEDEIPEWMEGDEYSDYHTMVCYTFPPSYRAISADSTPRRFPMGQSSMLRGLSDWCIQKTYFSMQNGTNQKTETSICIGILHSLVTWRM